MNEYTFDFALIIPGQQRIVNAAEDVKRIIIPKFRCLDLENILEVCGEGVGIIVGHEAEALSQSVGDGAVVIFGTIGPDVRGQGFGAAARVGNVKDVFQPGAASGFVDQGNPVAAAPHVATHTGVPCVVIGAGRRAGPLGEDQELLLERVLVEPGGRAEEGRPVALIPGDFSGGVLRHLDVIIKFFVRHGSFLSDGKIWVFV